MRRKLASLRALVQSSSAESFSTSAIRMASFFSSQASSNYKVIDHEVRPLSMHAYICAFRPVWALEAAKRDEFDWPDGDREPETALTPPLSPSPCAV